MPGFDEELEKQIRAAKENKTKFHNLVIGDSANKNIIDDFDSNWVYDANNGNCLSQLVKDINTL